MFGSLIALLAMIGLLVLWCFFNFQPQYANKKQLSVFNWTIVGFILILCVPYCFYIDSLIPELRREQYLKAFIVGGCLLIEIVVLAIAFLLRNFWIFKPSKRNFL